MRVTFPTVRLWCWRTDALTAEAAERLGTLSPAERDRGRRFRCWRDRRDFAAAHHLLRTSLSREAEVPPEAWAFETDARGRPRLGGPPGEGVSTLDFNLTHTRGLVACVVGRDRRVGVDAERRRHRVDVDGVAAMCLSEAERDSLPAGGDDRVLRLLELWTLKEAFVKALGVGLARPLADLSFTLRDDGTVGFDAPRDVAGAAWRFAVFAPSDDARVAVAVSGARAPVVAAVSDAGAAPAAADDGGGMTGAVGGLAAVWATDRDTGGPSPPAR